MTKESSNDSSRDTTYFNYYSMITHQQNMLQDYGRTSTYRSAITLNPTDFYGKVVLDVGCGSGILSFFCAQAGAKRVYAVEASGMADLAKKLVKGNNLENVITVIQGKIEDITLPEKVDVIVSEPIGVFLVHERMIESFVYARDKFLKDKLECDSSYLIGDDVISNCHMYPSRGRFIVAPFTDAALFTETMTKARFWEQKDFYGVNLCSLKKDAIAHYFSQPIVGSFDGRILLASPASFDVDFHNIKRDELFNIEIPFSFKLNYTGIIHGLAGWFDIDFEGSDLFVKLSTSPFEEKTHWYQIRFLFQNPIAVNQNSTIEGVVSMHVNDQRSYEVIIKIPGQDLSQKFNLHEQQYSYFTPSIGEEFKPEHVGLYAKETK